MSNYNQPEDDIKTLIDKSLAGQEGRTLLEGTITGEDKTFIDNEIQSEGQTWARGEVIDGLYLVENIARGGMGIIYFVEHLKWGIKLVVKSPLAEFLKDEHKSRFIREAEEWVDLGKHPNIATAFYVREVKGIPAIFIEFADGGTLSDRLKEKKLKNFPEILDVAIQFCAGIIHAHGKGLIHRDIKPDNVLMMKDGTVKITDFGLVKSKNKDSAHPVQIERPSSVSPQEWHTITSAGAVGTPPYMPPEQWADSDKTDKRADIYSFGVMLFEIICNRCPFIKEKDNPYPPVIAYQMMHRFNQPPDPKEFRRDISEKLKKLILKCLEKTPEKRYGTFEEIQYELIGIYREITGKDYERPLPGEAELKADDLNNRALSYIDLGKKPEARKCLEEAIKLDPGSLAININLILLLSDETWDSYENIKDRFKGLKEEHPNNSSVYYYEAAFELERGSPLTALSLITQSLSIDNSNPVLWNFKAVIFMTLKKYKEALGLLQRALHFEVTGQIYRRNYASVLYYLGRYEESCKEFSTLLKVSPHDKDLKIDMAVALTGTGKFSAAIDMLRDVLKTDPSSLRANIYLGELLLGIKTFVPTFSYSSSREEMNSGASHFEKAMSLAPGYCRISNILRKLGKKLPDKTWCDISARKTAGPEENIIELNIGEIKTLEKPDGGKINGVSFFRDGKKILSANHNSSITLWDIQEEKFIKNFTHMTGITYEIFDVDVSPDDNYIAGACGDYTVKIWDVSGGQCINTLSEHKQVVRSVQFSRDGKFLASSDSYSEINIWDLSTGQCIKNFNCNGGTVFSVRFSPDGKFIASGNQKGEVQIWNIETGEIYKRISAHTAPVMGLSYSPDGRFLVSAGEDRLIKLWDIDKEKCLHSFAGHIGQIETVHFSPDGRYIASGSRDGIVKIWNVRNGLCIRTLSEHSASVTGVEFSPDGSYIISGSKDRTIRYINIPLKGDVLYQGRYIKEFLIVKPRTVRESFEDVELFEKLIIQGEKYITEENYEKAMNSFREAQAIPGYRKNEHVLSGIHRAGMSGVRNGIRSVWLKDTFNSQGKGINKFEILKDTLIIYSSKDNIFRLMNLENRNIVKTFAGHRDRIVDFKISDDLNYLISGSYDKTVKLWDIRKGECIKTISMQHKIGSVAIFPGNHYIGVGGGSVTDNTVKIFSVETETCLRTFEGHKAGVNRIGLLRKGRLFITGSEDKTLKLWNIDNSKYLKDYKGHSQSINHRMNDIAIYPDEKYFASAGSDRTLKIWDIEEEEALHDLTGHEGEVTSVDISSDGNFVVSASADKTIRLWDGKTGAQLRVLTGSAEEVTDVKFYSEGRYILSFGKDDTIKLWEIDWEWIFPEETFKTDMIPVPSEESEIVIESEEETYKPENKLETKKLQYKEIAVKAGIFLVIITCLVFLFNFLKSDKQKMNEHLQSLIRRFPASINWKEETEWYLKYNNGSFKITGDIIDKLSDIIDRNKLKLLKVTKIMSRRDMTNDLTKCGFGRKEIEIILEYSFWPPGPLVDPVLEVLTKRLDNSKTVEEQYVILKLLEGIYRKDRPKCTWNNYYLPVIKVADLLKSEDPSIRAMSARVLGIILRYYDRTIFSPVQGLNKAFSVEDSYWSGHIQDIEHDKKGNYYNCIYCHSKGSRFLKQKTCNMAEEKPYEFVKPYIKTAIDGLGKQ